MIRKTIIVVLTLAAVGTGLAWGLSHIVVGEVFKDGSDPGFSWGDPRYPHEGLFLAVTEGAIVIVRAPEWDYERQQWTRGVYWDWVTMLRSVIDPRNSATVSGVEVPMGFLFVLFASYPTIAFIRGPLRRRRRRKRGLCLTCGYDLRGSPERCPECGNEES